MTRQPSSKYRGVILSLLALSMVINYMDRAALSIAMPFMSHDFHLSATEKGAIFSSFFVGYSLFNFVGGYLSDRIGPKRVFVWSMTSWSIFCGMTALTGGFWSLLTLRVLFGAGEGPISTSANKVVNSWFPLRERARAIGINQAGGPLGGALAGPVVGYLALQFGWRVAFIAIAVTGICWMFAWRRLATDTPQTHARVTQIELRDITGNSTSQPKKPMALVEVLRRPAVYIMALSLFCCSYSQFFFLTWFPTYLIDARGMSLSEMSVFSSIPWLAGAVGYVSSGVLIDWIYSRTGRRAFSRKVVLATCLVGAALCMVTTVQVQSAVGAIFSMSAGVSLLMLASPAYWALIQDVVPDSAVGSASGVMHGLGNTSGIVGPVITGMLIQVTGGYTSAFVLASSLATAGAILVIIGIKSANRQDVKERVAAS